MNIFIYATIIIWHLCIKPSENCQPTIMECIDDANLVKSFGMEGAAKTHLLMYLEKALVERAECNKTQIVGQYYALQYARVKQALELLEKTETAKPAPAANATTVTPQPELYKERTAHETWKILGIVFICSTVVLAVGLFILLGVLFCKHEARFVLKRVA